MIIKKCAIFFSLCALLFLVYYFIEIPASNPFFITIKGATLEVEIADTPYLRKLGLMGRQALPQHRGVLFIFPFEAIQTFWMKNTTIPLSLAFIRKDGRILQILQMEPDQWDRRLAEYRSNEKVCLALEVNQGWFEKQGITAGDKIHFSRSVQGRLQSVE